MNLDLTFISFIEGLTEFLPVSSTAHLIIAAKLLSVDTVDSYIKFYLLFVQLGALLAGLSLFARRLLNDKKLLTNICISFLPSAAIGFVFYKMFKHLLEGNIPLLVAMLFLGGVIFIYLERIFMKKNGVQGSSDFGTSEMSKADALIVGLAQAVAIIPGVSRSGATIIAGILRGIKKATIIDYTFILALPTLGAAVLYDAYKSRDMLYAVQSYGELGTGFIVAFLTAVATLYFMKKFLYRISLTVFGWYRIVLAILVFFVLI